MKPIIWIISTLFWCRVSSLSEVFLLGPTDKAKLTGENTVFRCSLSQNTTFRTIPATVPYKLTWTYRPVGASNHTEIVKWTRYFDGTYNRESSNPIRYPEDKATRLSIPDTRPEDAGLYSCSTNLTNEVMSAELYVLERPTCHNQYPELRYGHIATFDCHVQFAGNKAPTIYWQLGREKRNTTTEMHNSTSMTATLNITAGVNMNGHIYNCITTYARLINIQCQAMPPLKVYVPAAITDLTVSPKRGKLAYNEGSKVHLTCLARGYPLPHFSWTFTPFTNPTASRLMSSSSYYDISSFEERHAGLYRCSVDNDIDGVVYQDHRDINITVIKRKATTKIPNSGGQEVPYTIHRNSQGVQPSIDATSQAPNNSIFNKNSSKSLDFVEASFKYLSIFSPYAIGALVSAGLAVLLIIIFVVIAMRMKKKEHKMREKMARSHDETLDDQEVELLDESVQLQSDYRPSEYSKLRMSWEIPRRDIRLVEQIGKGSYVEIWKGRMRKTPSSNEIVRVCIKKLNSEASEKEKRFFLSELEVLKMIKTHTNVIRLAGSYTANEPWLMMLELASEGSLQEFLQQFRPGHHVVIKRGENEGVRLRSQSLSAHKLLALSAQTVSGLTHLTKFKLVYYRLKTASILCAKGGICKLSGFGFPQDITERNQYEPASSPTRWMSPESLVENIYNTQTDIWAYGIVLWEIFHFGMTPYPGMGPQEVLEKVHSGYRMPRPPHMSPELYHLMLSCWNSNPDDRPAYSYILERLTVMASNHAAHLFMDKLPDFVKVSDGLDILS
ncbi:fibroblast growth factor receptor homolog 1 isoform X2 [Patella vulgata]|uniref:fibroblast growth factor receptor homolog 1 isoform X2 n=1 Tax=Patella vulgata TaxID=6465 RepID=UPI00217FB716|nr:fibroblast growth factor receptor homolog 1 isoform X2 [Patella vulgata]